MSKNISKYIKAFQQAGVRFRVMRAVRQSIDAEKQAIKNQVFREAALASTKKGIWNALEKKGVPVTTSIAFPANMTAKEIQKIGAIVWGVVVGSVEAEACRVAIAEVAQPGKSFTKTNGTYDQGMVSFSAFRKICKPIIVPNKVSSATQTVGNTHSYRATIRQRAPQGTGEPAALVLS